MCFLIYEQFPSSIEVAARKNSSKVPLQGIFVGAKVVRGPDWDWGNQDGGPGEMGRVTEIRGWDGESSRSVASVLWSSSGVNNVYRLGHKGKVDLKCEQAATFGHIYIHHLPILGRSSPGGAAGQPPALTGPTNASPPPFLVGEKVRVKVTLQELRTLQEGHGGWNHKMSEYVAQVGVVHRITDKGDVRVQYDGCVTRWTIHPFALARVSTSFSSSSSGTAVAPASHTSTGVGPQNNGGAVAPHYPPTTHAHHQHHHYYTPGDRVTVIADEEKVKSCQKGHGEWIDYMRAVSFDTVSEVTFAITWGIVKNCLSNHSLIIYIVLLN